MTGAAGLQIMHLGRAIELLELLADTERGQTWRVRPLFVDNQEPEVVTIKQGDHCTSIHSQRNRAWRPRAA
jgi:hypothetical protein